MRNLKRALSLAVASVMLLGLMVVGTGAASVSDFTDADEISNEEAAAVTTAIGIFAGYDDGSFRPDNAVTRAEMATIICKMLYGSDVNASQFTGTSVFTDVTGEYAWAEGYVNLCSSLGIVGGYGDGLFGPGDTVTTAQATLMLCKALGYFQTEEEYGTSWELAATTKGTELGFFGDLTLGANEPLTRDNVAVMVLNALTNATSVSYNSNFNIYYTQSWTDGVLEVDSSVIDGSATITSPKFEDSDYQYTLGWKTFGLYTQDSTDDFGRPSAYRWYVKGQTSAITGTYTAEADLTYTSSVSSKTIYSDLGLTSSIDDAKLYIDGVPQSDITLDRSGSNYLDDLNGYGILTEVFADGDEVVITIINTYLAKAVADYDEDDEELQIEVQADITLDDDVLSNDDFAVSEYLEDDYLLITAYVNIEDEYVVASVSPVDVLDNVVVTSSRTDDYVTADGTRYYYNDTSVADSSALGNDLMTGSSDYDLNGDAYTLYLDSYGYVIGVDGYSAGTSVDDYLFVTQTGTSAFDNVARVVFMDGSTQTVTVSELDNNDDFEWATSQGGADKFYSYDVDRNGDYELTSLTKGSNEGSVTWNSKSYAEDADVIEDDATPIVGVNRAATSSTVFIADDQVYVGVRNAPTVTGEKGGTTVYYLLDENNRLLAVYTSTAGVSSTDTDELVYILDDSYATSSDGDVTYYTYTAIVNGEKGELDSNDAGLAEGLYRVDSYTDGYADLSDQIDSGDDDLITVTELRAADYEGSVLTTTGTGGGVNSWILDDDVTILTVDGTTVRSISASGVRNAVNNGFTTAYLVEASSSNSDIVMIILVDLS